jgi:N-acyl-D-aspartate/D-glutamate deacylase
MRVRRLALLLATSILSLGAAPPEQVDLMIRGGTVYTGTDAPFVGDVAISGDRIRAVGKSLSLPAKRVVDASGMIVAPGFIDPHTHAAEQLASDDAGTRLIPAFLMQGVTTAFIGNDGGGDPEVAAVLGSAQSKPVGINYAAYVGLGPVRRQVIGDVDRAPTPAELARMKQLVASAMCQGALGFSTGLFYAPQSFSKSDEVVALAREAGLRGGTYDSHLRDESSYSIGLAAAVDEAITVGREARLPVNISHIKALGVDVHGQAPAIIARIEAAQRAGQKVTADQYPWSASGTSLASSLVPRWAQDGGRAALLKRFDDPLVIERLRSEMGDNLRRRGGAESLLITEGEQKGRRLAEVAKAMGLSPVAAAIVVIRVADPSVASFNQTEADIAAFMRRPWVMTGSDASTGHPRAYGTFPRKYSEYVVARKVITLRDFIERSTALPADTFGLEGRGRLKRGAFADVVVFDPKRFSARATYEQPTLLATGVRTVLVNGVLAVDNGDATGAAAGRAIAKTPPPGSCPQR